MKNFLLGIIVFVLLSFTAINTDIITIKPSLPKSTVVFEASSPTNCVKKIKEYVREGYITKSVAGSHQYGYYWVVVMEKY